MEGAGNKQKRVLLTIKANIDTCNRLECSENHNKFMKEYGIGSSTIYVIRIIIKTTTIRRRRRITITIIIIII
jgi:hypothetical protein